MPLLLPFGTLPSSIFLNTRAVRGILKVMAILNGVISMRKFSVFIISALFFAFVPSGYASTADFTQKYNISISASVAQQIVDAIARGVPRPLKPIGRIESRIDAEAGNLCFTASDGRLVGGSVNISKDSLLRFIGLAGIAAQIVDDQSFCIPAADIQNGARVSFALEVKAGSYTFALPEERFYPAYWLKISDALLKSGFLREQFGQTGSGAAYITIIRRGMRVDLTEQDPWMILIRGNRVEMTRRVTESSVLAPFAPDDTVILVTSAAPLAIADSRNTTTEATRFYPVSSSASDFMHILSQAIWNELNSGSSLQSKADRGSSEFFWMASLLSRIIPIARADQSPSDIAQIAAEFVEFWTRDMTAHEIALEKFMRNPSPGNLELLETARRRLSERARKFIPKPAPASIFDQAWDRACNVRELNAAAQSVPECASGACSSEKIKLLLQEKLAEFLKTAADGAEGLGYQGSAKFTEAMKDLAILRSYETAKSAGQPGLLEKFVAEIYSGDEASRKVRFLKRSDALASLERIEGYGKLADDVRKKLWGIDVEISKCTGSVSGTESACKNTCATSEETMAALQRGLADISISERTLFSRALSGGLRGTLSFLGLSSARAAAVSAGRGVRGALNPITLVAALAAAYTDVKVEQDETARVLRRAIEQWRAAQERLGKADKMLRDFVTNELASIASCKAKYVSGIDWAFAELYMEERNSAYQELYQLSLLIDSLKKYQYEQGGGFAGFTYSIDFEGGFHRTSKTRPGDPNSDQAGAILIQREFIYYPSMCANPEPPSPSGGECPAGYFSPNSGFAYEGTCLRAPSCYTRDDLSLTDFAGGQRYANVVYNERKKSDGTAVGIVYECLDLPRESACRNAPYYPAMTSEYIQGQCSGPIENIINISDTPEEEDPNASTPAKRYFRPSLPPRSQ